MNRCYSEVEFEESVDYDELDKSKEEDEGVNQVKHILDFRIVDEIASIFELLT
jgi:hypothetical protein